MRHGRGAEARRAGRIHVTLAKDMRQALSYLARLTYLSLGARQAEVCHCYVPKPTALRQNTDSGSDVQSKMQAGVLVPRTGLFARFFNFRSIRSGSPSKIVNTQAIPIFQRTPPWWAQWALGLVACDLFMTCVHFFLDGF